MGQKRPSAVAPFTCVVLLFLVCRCRCMSLCVLPLHVSMCAATASPCVCCDCLCLSVLPLPFLGCAITASLCMYFTTACPCLCYHRALCHHPRQVLSAYHCLCLCLSSAYHCLCLRVSPLVLCAITAFPCLYYHCVSLCVYFYCLCLCLSSAAGPPRSPAGVSSRRRTRPRCCVLGRAAHDVGTVPPLARLSFHCPSPLHPHCNTC